MQLVQQCPTTGWLMSCPLPFSSAHSFRRLSDVHNCRRIGSPRVAGSSSASRSESRVGSSVILDLRPHPAGVSGHSQLRHDLGDLQALDILSVAQTVASATALTPPCPIIRASDAASVAGSAHQQRSHRLQRFRRALMSELFITRRFYRGDSIRESQAIILAERDKMTHYS